MFTLHDLHQILEPEHHETVQAAVARASSGLWHLTRWAVYDTTGTVIYRSKP